MTAPAFPTVADSSASNGYGWTPKPKSARAILAEKFRAVRWVIPDILPEGAYLLAAKPKVGKSWLALQLCVAVVGEQAIFGKLASGGAALYLALEDNDRRIQRRLAKQIDGLLLDPACLDRLHFETQWRRGDEGAADLAVWIEQHPDCRLVVIDTLERIRPARGSSGAVYAEDYAAIKPFKDLSDRYGVTLLIVHHTRKGDSDDPLEQVSGTLGLTGSADGVLVLTKPRGEARGELHLIGRDIEQEGAFVVEFDADRCQWSMVGEAHQVADTEQQQAVMDCIRDLGPIQPKDIAAEIERKDATVRRFLQKLRKSGRIVKTPAGYILNDERNEHDEQRERRERNERDEQTDPCTG